MTLTTNDSVALRDEWIANTQFIQSKTHQNIAAHSDLCDVWAYFDEGRQLFEFFTSLERREKFDR